MDDINKNILPKIYIIILNWNGYSDTKECIVSLLKVKYDNYKIVIVDNGSEDGSDIKLKKDFGDNNIYFIKNEKNLGFAEGNNIGIKYALENNADYILLLNNDTIVDPIFLEEALKYTCNGTGIVGIKIYYYSAPNVIWFAGGTFSCLKGSTTIFGMNKIDDKEYSNNKEIGYVAGCAILIKREVFEKVGLLDKEYFIYSEELDFCLRTKRAGYKIVFVPTSKVWHKVARTMKGNYSPFYLYFQSKNRLLLVKKNFSKIYLLYCIIIHFLFYIPYKLIIILFSKKMKLKSSFSLFLGTYDFLVNNKNPKFIS